MGCHRPSGRCPGLHRPLDLRRRHGQRAAHRTSGTRPRGTMAEQAHCRAGRVRVRRWLTDNKEPRFHHDLSRDLSERQFPYLRTGDDNRGGLRALSLGSDAGDVPGVATVVPVTQVEPRRRVAGPPGSSHRTPAISIVACVPGGAEEKPRPGVCAVPLLPLLLGGSARRTAPLSGPTASVPRSALWPQLFSALSGLLVVPWNPAAFPASPVLYLPVSTMTALHLSGTSRCLVSLCGDRPAAMLLL